jgi:hypothetical protein
VIRSDVDFIETLVNRFPVVQPIYQEHLKDNGGELLPHPFCGDLTRLMVSLYASGSAESDARQQLTELLNFLESAFSDSDESVINLIAVSILENFPSTGEEYYDIRNLLGPNLADELQRVNW